MPRDPAFTPGKLGTHPIPKPEEKMHSLSRSEYVYGGMESVDHSQRGIGVWRIRRFVEARKRFDFAF